MQPYRHSTSKQRQARGVRYPSLSSRAAWKVRRAKEYPDAPATAESREAWKKLFPRPLPYPVPAPVRSRRVPRARGRRTAAPRARTASADPGSGAKSSDDDDGEGGARAPRRTPNRLPSHTKRTRLTAARAVSLAPAALVCAAHGRSLPSPRNLHSDRTAAGTGKVYAMPRYRRSSTQWLSTC